MGSDGEVKHEGQKIYILWDPIPSRQAVISGKDKDVPPCPYPCQTPLSLSAWAMGEGLFLLALPVIPTRTLSEQGACFFILSTFWEKKKKKKQRLLDRIQLPNIKCCLFRSLDRPKYSRIELRNIDSCFLFVPQTYSYSSTPFPREPTQSTEWSSGYHRLSHKIKIPHPRDPLLKLDYSWSRGTPGVGGGSVPETAALELFRRVSGVESFSENVYFHVSLALNFFIVVDVAEL